MVRQFWVAYMGVEASSDGQIKGWRVLWDSFTPSQQRLADATIQRCIQEILVGADPMELIPDYVAALKADLPRLPEPERGSPAYGRYRVELIQRILAERLTPVAVADDLEHNGAERFAADEIKLYREWGDRWGGPILAGPVWHRVTGKLEPWPHDGLVVWP